MTIPADTKTLFHRADPESSKLAVERHTESGRRSTHIGTVYAALRESPGRTAAELHRNMGEPFKVEEVRRRLYELQQEQPPRAYRGAQRKCHVANTTAVVWWPMRAKHV